MSHPMRRGRVRTVTEPAIRHTARKLLVEQGVEAVTLRAIARQLGITAPALYRYYDSRDDLIAGLRREVCADLAAELDENISELDEDGAVRLFAICKGFRHWALAHPREFTLVFASPTGKAPSALRRADEPFGRIFLAAAGRVLAGYDLVAPPVDTIPTELRADLDTFRTDLLAVLVESVPDFPTTKLDLGVTYLMLQFWARLYGHVTLEVFGNYPIPTSNPDLLFETTLADLAREVGL